MWLEEGGREDVGKEWRKIMRFEVQTIIQKRSGSDTIEQTTS